MGTFLAQAFALEAHAKVNLCLAVQHPPVEGYHQAHTVMQEIDLHDVLRFSVADGVLADAMQTRCGTSVVLRCDLPGLNPADNLIFRAIDAAEQSNGVPIIPAGSTLMIDVEKHLPAGGGMGGGSSDAAAALKAYARLTGVDPRDARLVEVARALGADVAFFLFGGAALLGGRGDEFERALPALDAPIVLMGDAEGMSTARVYQAFDERPKPAPDARELARLMLEEPRDNAAIAARCANNLGDTVRAVSPRIAHRVEAALEHPGVLNALVSGSGATSFAICENEQVAEGFAQDIAPLCDWVRVCRIPPFAS